MSDTANDFSKGSIVSNIMKLAVPMTMAQLINVLYNIIDRIYIGRIPENATLALTGLGLCLPIISMVIAFANLFGMGGAPLCSIERGRGNKEEAELIMGNSFVLMVIFGIGLTVVGLALKKPMLYLFGASDNTYPYADQYISIYLLGSIFVMIGLGMNSFINSQGFGTIGMMTVLLGAVANIILDPVFIFLLDLGVKGAAFGVPAEEGAGEEHRGPRHVGLYHGDHQQLGTDHVQCVTAALRRGSVRRDHDRDQLCPGNHFHAG